MEKPFRPIHTGSDADLAFAVVVLASYFTTFSTLQSTSSYELLLMIGLGVAYIAAGIYGYALVSRINTLGFHLGYFALQMILGGLIVNLGRTAPFNAMVLLPLAGHSAVLLSKEWRAVVNVLIVAVYIFATGIFNQGWAQVWSGLPIFMGGQIFILVFTQMAVNEERARSEAQKLANDLAAANQHLREYALQAEELAITKERNRLAREIHDGLGHYLTTIFMQLQAARAVMKVDPHKGQDALTTAQNLTQEALVDVRRSVSTLRGALDDGLQLMDELEKMLKDCERAGIASELKIIGPQRSLPPQTQWTVYRAVQEGISNTSKHARATSFSVTLDYSRADQVRLSVQDNGIGADQIDGGFGLIGMRERVHLLKGDFEIVTAPGEGFKFEARIPG